jgi:sugar/nucleoside kinase (ribokinase family)
MLDVVVVGAAARDLDPSEERGWRAGGSVSYGALQLARLGLRVGAVVGLDAVALAAGEPAALRAAGVQVVPVPLVRGPVFENRETPQGRWQRCHATADPLPPAALPATWRATRAFLFAPVAGELGPEWSTVPGADAIVGLGWQGLLRDLVAGRPPGRLPPRATPLQGRADVTVLSREDVPVDQAGDPMERLLARSGGILALTAGRAGGVQLRRKRDGGIAVRRWFAVPARREVDPTGAGDVFLAALFAARLGADPACDEGSAALLFAATAASLSVEGVGLTAVPDLAGIRRRLRELAGG